MTAAPDQTTLFAAVADALRAICRAPLPGLTPQTTLESIPDLDSLRLIDATVRLEQKLGVEVDTDRLGQLVTIADLVHLLAASRRT
jgi:acyl carrier protein